MRLIDTDKLKEAINTELKAHLVYLPIAFKDLIDNAPTVDTTCPHCDSGYAQGYSDGYLKGKEERPQGKWILCEDTYFSKCSICGDIWLNEECWNYCSNCGADMRSDNHGKK